MIPRTDQQLTLARACNLFGDLLCVNGKPYKAIIYHERTSSIASNNNTKDSGFYRLRYSSVLNRGLCYLSLREVTKAHKFFLDLKNSLLDGISQKNFGYLGVYNLFRANFCLSLTYSLINDKKNTLLCIAQNNSKLNEPLFNSAWSKGYSLIFTAQAYKNIKLLKESLAKYQEAINFAEDCEYFQVKAIALYGIGEIERINHEYPSALSYIQTAVDILQKIRLAPDLAEAYFQLGLTYQAMGEHNQAEEYKAKAIDLFEQMEAPKQIERVNKAFGGNIQ